MTTAVQSQTRREVGGAWLLVAGGAVVLLALAWDSEWHVDVGPDTFFTAPHSMMYGGVALMGLTSLAIVLLNTWRGRPGGVGRSVTVFRTFQAPVPFLIGGLGASAFLLYGLADLWWHTIYGFDLAGTSWPHAGLLLGQWVQISAAVIAFAAFALQGRRSAGWGLAAACALAVATAMPAAGSVVELLPGVAPLALVMAGVSALALGLVTGITRSARWVLVTGLAFLAIQLGTFFFAPYATEVYADVLGLSMRELAARVSFIAIQYPGTFPIAAVVAAALVWQARRSGGRPAGTVLLCGAVTGPVIALWYLLLGFLGDSNVDPVVAAWTVAGAAVVGAAAGWFGWQCAVLLRLREAR